MVLNILKKHKNSYYKPTQIGLLFLSSVQNDTKKNICNLQRIK